MVLNYSRKIIGGWTNHPCTVTSHMIDEKKMGNRGSKSEFLSNSVKEQRADGSWCINPNFMYLRCALTGFERNYPINYPSNQFKKLPFSTLIQPKLNPWLITGFTDAEGCFNLKIGSSATTSIGARIQLRFGIGLHIRELDVIKGLATYFNLLYPIASKSFEVSDVKYKNIAISSKAVTFNITKYSDIVNIIIPFFDKFPIQGQKALDFEDFKKVADIMKTNDHLTAEGFLKILKIKEGMNQNRLW